MTRKPSLQRWLDQCGLSIADAADLLGMRQQRLYELAQGKSYQRPARDGAPRGHRPAAPDLLLRFAMAAVAAKLKPPADVVAHMSSPGERETDLDKRVALAAAAIRAKIDPWPEK
jgi:hypothetical protein